MLLWGAFAAKRLVLGCKRYLCVRHCWYGIFAFVLALVSHKSLPFSVENNLYFILPEEVFFLTNLSALQLDGNAISGTISTSIGALSNLLFLTLDFNLFASSIPSELGRLTSLGRFVIDSMFARVRSVSLLP